MTIPQFSTLRLPQKNHTKMQKTKLYDAYNRAGWGMFCFSISNSIVATVLLVAWIFIIVITDPLRDMIFIGGDFYNVLGSSIALLIRNAPKFGLAIALTAAAGMIAGLLVFRSVSDSDRKSETLRKIPAPERCSLTLRQFLTYFIAACGLWGIGCVIGNLPELLEVSGGDIMSDFYGYIGEDGLLPVYAYSILAAPILEELLFRKLLLDRVHAYDPVTACFSSALLFALAHGNPAQFPYAFALGLLFSLVYLRTGKIMYTISMHMLINIIGSLPDLIGYSGTDVSRPWNILMLLLTVAGILVIIFCRRSRLFAMPAASPDLQECNPGRNAFGAAGIKAFISVETIMVTAMGIAPFAQEMLVEKSMRAHILLIPCAVSAAMVILTVKTVGRDRFRSGKKIQSGSSAKQNNTGKIRKKTGNPGNTHFLINFD